MLLGTPELTRGISTGRAPLLCTADQRDLRGKPRVPAAGVLEMFVLEDGENQCEDSLCDASCWLMAVGQVLAAIVVAVACCARPEGLPPVSRVLKDGVRTSVKTKPRTGCWPLP